MSDLKEQLRGYGTYLDEIGTEQPIRVAPEHRWSVERRLVAALVVAALVGAIGLVFVLTREQRSSGKITVGADNPSPATTTALPTTTSMPSTTTLSGPQVSVFAGLPALDASALTAPLVPVSTVSVPGDVPVEGFLGFVGGTLWLAGQSADRSALTSEVFPLDGSVSGLQVSGLPLGFAEGEGARWVYVREVQNPDQQYRLLRFTNNDAAPAEPPTVQNNPVPVDGQPAGPLVVGNGGVWIPLRNGVARMDTHTGELVTTIPLPFQQSRSVVIFGSQILVSHENAIYTIDPASNTLSSPHEIVPSGQGTIDGLANVNGTIWADIEQGTSAAKLLRLDASLGVDAHLPLPAPGSFSLDSGDGQLWVLTPLRIGVPETAGATDQAALLIDPTTASITQTVVFHGTAGNVAWTANNELLFSGRQNAGSGGPVDTTLYQVSLDATAPR
jgi:hypothetical protein